MARQDYLSELVEKNHNQRFFESADTMRDFQRNLKRIIKDIAYNNIRKELYVYFSNETVINTCIAECYNQANEASAMANASRIYYYDYLLKGYTPYYNIDRTMEMTIVSNKIVEFGAKAARWSALQKIFMSVKDNKQYNPYDILYPNINKMNFSNIDL